MKYQSKTMQTLIKKKASLDEAGEYAESIINTVHELLIILDQDLRVFTSIRSFYEFFKVKPEETEGQLIYNLLNIHWNRPGRAGSCWKPAFPFYPLHMDTEAQGGS